MKTLLFSPMWLDAENRLERNTKWIEFYLPLKDKLEVDEILLVDNASKEENLDVIRKYPVTIHKCEEHLPRIGLRGYPYWYRAFRIAGEKALNEGYDKIIHIDTDVYLLKDNICNYIKNLSSGWNTFYCKKYGFPESTMQIICKDKIQEMTNWMKVDALKHCGKEDAENVIPFTHIEKSFIGDRYGETSEQQTTAMEYYCQTPNEVKLIYDFK